MTARPGSPDPSHRGYFHQAAIYGSDAEFLDVVVPFLHDSVEAGEPTLALLGPHHQRLVKSALGAAAGPEYLDGNGSYLEPATTIRAVRRRLDLYRASGARQARIAAHVPHPGLGASWDAWARYEAAVNLAYAEFQLWGVCLYDSRITADHVLDDVTRTHPYLSGHGAEQNPGFEDPVQFLRRHTATRGSLLRPQQPMMELVDPEPAAARHTVLGFAGASGVGHDSIADLALAVTEVVTNAICHGLPPVHVRFWAEPNRLTVTVTDGGGGPSDPLAGLLPAADPRSGGLGLWLSHQICSQIAMSTSEGFTVRLVAGTPSLDD